MVRDTDPHSETLAQEELPVHLALRDEECCHNEEGRGGRKGGLEHAFVEEPSGDKARDEDEGILRSNERSKRSIGGSGLPELNQSMHCRQALALEALA